MIEKLLEFSIKHIGLVSLAVALLFLLGVIEWLQWVWGSRALSPNGVAVLINRHQAKILDLRIESEFLKVHLPNALHVTSLPWEVLLEKLMPTQPLIFVTAGSTPSFSLTKKLRTLGFSKLYHLKGGIDAWKDSNLPVTKS